MASLNKVILMGNLTRDVEMRYTPSGMALARLGLAMNRVYKDTRTNERREEVTFVDVDVWGKQAETAHQYLSKGRPVLIEGRLRFDSWDDKQTGQKRSKLLVVADRVTFLPSGGGAGGAPGGAPRPPQAAGNRPPQQRPAPPAPDQQDAGPEGSPPEDLDIPEENIPF